MVDLNINILGKTDCGEPEYNSALEVVKYAFNKGVKNMVIAAKCGVQESNLTIDEVEERVERLSEKLHRNNVNVKLYCAQNVQLSEGNLKECLEGKVATINKSRYMIVDLNETMTDEQVDMVFELTIKGIVPIIAHPERYKELEAKISRIEKLKELGCLFQLDINSLKGAYGKKTKSIAKQLLKANIYDFAASEANEQANRKKRYTYSILSKSEREVFRKNGLKVLKNDEISNHIGAPKVKKRLLGL